MDSQDWDDTDSLDVEAPDPATEPTNSIDWEQEARKAFAARDKARVELHRTKLEHEYGTEVASLIPEGLPPKEWKTYADKLVAFRGEQKTGTPETSAEETPDAEAPDLPDASKLAGIVNGPSGSASGGSGAISRADWLNLVEHDSSEAERLFQAGKVDFTDLRQGLGPDR